MKGILDYDGKNKNPLNNNDYSDEYKKLSNIWSKFPAYKDAKEHIKKIKDNQVNLVISGTGSGKTVLFPKYALHSLDYNGKIAITLPKKIIAKSAAEFASKTLDVEITKDVGYQYRNSLKDGKTFTDETKLLYMTDGTLLARLLTDPNLSEFDIVIIDEAHERKVNIDFLLLLLRRVLINRKDFKLIIMSATINEKIFIDYFSNISFNVVNIGSKTNYPIESIYLEEAIDTNKYIDVGVDMINKFISNSNKDKINGIIFFVTSISETKKICENIDSNKIECISVYSGMSKDRELLATDQKIFEEKFPNKIKLIISTNVAESSLTIEGIDVVIDSGLELKSRFDYENRIDILEKGYITKAQVKQRKGRTGRTGKGKCYHLYTENEYKKMVEFPFPTIRVESISYEMVRLLNMDMINNVDELKSMLNDFIEPPNKRQVEYELKYLEKNNIINMKTGLTKLGDLVSSLQMDIEDSLMLILGFKLYCYNEILILNIFSNVLNDSLDKIIKVRKDENNMKVFNKIKKEYENNYGDYIGLLKLYNDYHSNNIKKSIENNIRVEILDKVRETFKRSRYRYIKVLKDNQDTINEIFMIDDIEGMKLTTRVLSAIQYGLKYNYVISKDNKMELNNKMITLDKSNLIDSKKKYNDKKIFYKKLFKFDSRPIKAKLLSIESNTSTKLIAKIVTKMN
jgi:pre-mRNA-splicing factor ATP-dependent RNA helicase DHX15/PRP43